MMTEKGIHLSSSPVIMISRRAKRASSSCAVLSVLIKSQPCNNSRTACVFPFLPSDIIFIRQQQDLVKCEDFDADRQQEQQQDSTFSLFCLSLVHFSTASCSLWLSCFRSIMSSLGRADRVSRWRSLGMKRMNFVLMMTNGRHYKQRYNEWMLLWGMTIQTDRNLAPSQASSADFILLWVRVPDSVATINQHQDESEAQQMFLTRTFRTSQSTGWSSSRLFIDRVDITIRNSICFLFSCQWLMITIMAFVYFSL